MSVSSEFSVPGQLVPASPNPPEPLAVLGSKLASLEQRVEALEAVQPLPRKHDWPPPVHLVEQIKRLTRELFPGSVVAEIDVDPSEPDDPWMNFWVKSDLDYDQLRPLRTRWYDAVRSLNVEDETRFRLGIARS